MVRPFGRRSGDAGPAPAVPPCGTSWAVSGEPAGAGPGGQQNGVWGADQGGNADAKPNEGPNKMIQPASKKQTARLEAIAVTELIDGGDLDGADVILNGSENPLELAAAACSLAASLLITSHQERRGRILEGFRYAALNGR